MKAKFRAFAVTIQNGQLATNPPPVSDQISDTGGKSISNLEEDNSNGAKDKRIKELEEEVARLKEELAS